MKNDAVNLNQFFQWCLRKKLLKQIPVMEAPQKDKTKEPKIPTITQRNMVEGKLRDLIAQWKLKHKNTHYHQSRKTSRELIYRNFLRFYILADYASMRRSEIWALKREDIDLDLNKRKIHIREKDEEGGKNR